MTSKEQCELVKRALVFYFPCIVCQKLGWNKECNKNKSNCGDLLYKNLEDFFYRQNDIKWSNQFWKK